MPSKRHQNRALLKTFHRRPQIREFCACKYNPLSFRRLFYLFMICAISEGRKTAFSGRNVRICSAVRASPGGRRGRCHHAAAALLQCCKGPAANLRGPYGWTGAFPACFRLVSTVLKRDFHLSPFFAQQCLQWRKVRTYLPAYVPL